MGGTLPLHPVMLLKNNPSELPNYSQLLVLLALIGFTFNSNKLVLNKLNLATKHNEDIGNLIHHDFICNPP